MASEKVQRLIRPEALQKDEPLVWSTGSGSDLWEMICAAIDGDLNTIKKLLTKNPALVRASHDYRPAIAFAVRENQPEIVAYLLANGANPVSSGTSDTLLQIARDRGYTAIQQLLEKALTRPGTDISEGEAIAAAIRARDINKVKALLDASPTAVHAPDENTNLPIHWAVMTRQPAMIDELLSRGANINAKRGNGALPIQLCNGDYNYRGWRDVPADTPAKPSDILKHLRARGAYCDICTACYIGDIARVRELLEEDPSLGNRPSDYVTYYACSGTPIRNAAAGGHIEIVKLLLEKGADPNLPEEHIAPRGHALHSAVVNGHIDIVKLLLDNGAYPNVEIESSADTLSAAIGRSDKVMIDLLCSYGAARKLHLLAYYGDTLVAAAMLAADPQLANDPYALENAATEGHEAFIRLMLHYQPDLAKRIAVGVRSKGPDSAIKSRELTELLFQHGMNPGFANWLRITPLHVFARRDEIEDARIFIEHGADINARDEEFCSTPLGYAARYGKTRMVEFLLKQGAKTNLPDDQPWATPLSWATRRGYNEIVDLLKQYGAVS